MKDKIRTDDIIVVEGKYDRIKVGSVVEGTIIETDGFGIFSEKQLKNTLKALAEKHEIIILTDSDAAGFKIRWYVASFLPKERVKHALIPDVAGKEKRKKCVSGEGKLGVEGMPEETVLRSLQMCGMNTRTEELPREKVTAADLFEMGLTGKEGSAERRRELLRKLSLPQRTGTKLLLSVVNSVMEREEFLNLANDICGRG